LNGQRDADSSGRSPDHQRERDGGAGGEPPRPHRRHSGELGGRDGVVDLAFAEPAKAMAQ
jgi:hypothetical protein